MSAIERDAFARTIARNLQLGAGLVGALAAAPLAAFVSQPAGPAQSDYSSMAIVGVLAFSCAAMAETARVIYRPGLPWLVVAYRNLDNPSRLDASVAYTDPADHNHRRARFNRILRSLARRFYKLSRSQPPLLRPSFIHRSELLITAAAADCSPGSPALSAAIQAAVTGDVGPLAPDPGYELASTRLEVPWAKIGAATAAITAVVAAVIPVLEHLRT